MPTGPIVGGIKDSFNDLALPGYRVGLSGDWWRAPAAVDAAPAHATTDLSQWCRYWSGSDTSTTFLPSLLDDLDLIFARTEMGGGLLNRGGGAVGISNTFGANPLTALTALAHSRWPGLPVVLWQDRSDSADALAAGLQPIGPMRVWFPLPTG